MLARLVNDFRDTMNPPVFLGSAGLILIFVLFGAGFSTEAETLVRARTGWLIDSFGWFYVLAASGMLGFVIWLGLSRFGEIRLGGDSARRNSGG